MSFNDQSLQTNGSQNMSCSSLKVFKKNDDNPPLSQQNKREQDSIHSQKFRQCGSEIHSSNDRIGSCDLETVSNCKTSVMSCRNDQIFQEQLKKLSELTQMVEMCCMESLKKYESSVIQGNENISIKENEFLKFRIEEEVNNNHYQLRQSSRNSRYSPPKRTKDADEPNQGSKQPYPSYFFATEQAFKEPSEQELQYMSMMKDPSYNEWKNRIQDLQTLFRSQQSYIEEIEKEMNEKERRWRVNAGWYEQRIREQDALIEQKTLKNNELLNQIQLQGSGDCNCLHKKWLEEISEQLKSSLEKIEILEEEKLQLQRELQSQSVDKKQMKIALKENTELQEHIERMNKLQTQVNLQNQQEKVSCAVRIINSLIRQKTHSNYHNSFLQLLKLTKQTKSICNSTIKNRTLSFAKYLVLKSRKIFNRAFFSSLKQYSKSNLTTQKKEKYLQNMKAFYQHTQSARITNQRVLPFLKSIQNISNRIQRKYALRDSFKTILFVSKQKKKFYYCKKFIISILQVTKKIQFEDMKNVFETIKELTLSRNKRDYLVKSKYEQRGNAEIIRYEKLPNYSLTYDERNNKITNLNNNDNYYSEDYEAIQLVNSLNQRENRNLSSYQDDYILSLEEDENSNNNNQNNFSIIERQDTISKMLLRCILKKERSTQIEGFNLWRNHVEQLKVKERSEKMSDSIQKQNQMLKQQVMDFLNKKNYELQQKQQISPLRARNQNIYENSLKPKLSNQRTNLRQHLPNEISSNLNEKVTKLSVNQQNSNRYNPSDHFNDHIESICSEQRLKSSFKKQK